MYVRLCRPHELLSATEEEAKIRRARAAGLVNHVSEADFAGSLLPGGCGGASARTRNHRVYGRRQQMYVRDEGKLKFVRLVVAMQDINFLPRCQQWTFVYVLARARRTL